ncbi:MAG TPA: tetratricopeptide repeat protein [Pseudolabrys sp.]|nr:tetratricopeptide repeat protein [Pseudolabrys sp.]
MAEPNEEKFRQALALLSAGRPDDAERQLKSILKRQPEHVPALNVLSVVLTQFGKYAEAERYIKTAIKLNPNSDASLYNYGLILKALNRPDEALALFSQSLSLNANVPETWNNRGAAMNDLERYDGAIADFENAIRLRPNYSEAYCNKGNSLAKLGRYVDALAVYEIATRLNSNLAAGWLGRGNACCALNRFADAFSAYELALKIDPRLADAWVGYGNAHCELERYDDAIRDFANALALLPDLADAWLGRGNALRGLKRYQEAIVAYEKALASKATLAEAWLGRGNVFSGEKRYDEALADYDTALKLKPNLGEAWLGRGAVFSALNRYKDALAAYGTALGLKPNLAGVEGIRLHTKMLHCDWTDFDPDCAHLLASIRNGHPNSQPFELLAIPSSSEDQLKCSALWTSTKYPQVTKPCWQGTRYDHKRIRVGYLSGDFRQHVVATLLVGMFECHDRARFDVHAISFGPDDNSPIRRRIEKSVDHFIDVFGDGDDNIARLITSLEIDILVDLMGFTTDARPGILARRPAPAQVSFLGFLGTMGAPFVDYIIADRTVIPEDRQDCYAEKIIYLPDCFQPTDRGREIGDKAFTRAELGLPATGFVYCCFNNCYKITPSVFDSWMRILTAVDGSVLWLFAEDAAARENLLKEAAARGVDDERLIFAPRVALAEHQARIRSADLFLDTWPYNAGATASDTLWAGVPLLTRLGETFVGRMAASMLQAIGLPGLIAPTQDAYEACAVDLAKNPGKLLAIRNKLAENRLTTPLFDTPLYTRHIEAAYREIHSSERPKTIYVQS